MNIASLQKTTLLDFPSHLACIVFLAGCNFRCPFCHSPELVLETLPCIPEREVFDFLEKRKGQLEGVVICGGEPSLQADLPGFCSKLKKLGYLVKLDTNGSNPEMLKALVSNHLVDYVALDIKTSKEKYKQVVGKDAALQVEHSVLVLKESGIDYELRTTCVPGIVDKEDILKIAQWVKGGKTYFLQSFRSEKTLNPAFKGKKPYSDQEMLSMKEIASPFFDFCSVR